MTGPFFEFGITLLALLYGCRSDIGTYDVMNSSTFPFEKVASFTTAQVQDIDTAVVPFLLSDAV